LANSGSTPEDVPGTAGSGILPAPAGGWATRPATGFDELERPAVEIFTAKDADGVAQWARVTQTSYTHNTVTVDPQVGGDVRTVTDAFDRPVRVEEHDGSAWQPTSYAYNLAGDLTTVTDPAGHPIRYGYDLAGRRIGMDDPDAGTTTDPNTWGWSYGYDPAGNQTRVTDARGTVVFTNYDQLNRPVERRRTNPTTGELMASWAYDAPGQAGLLDNSARWEHAGQHPGAYIVDVVGYDARNRPTGRSWTMFSADVPGLEGVYEVGYEYDRADHVTKTHYPQVGDPQNGGLPEETVTATYSNLGLPLKLDGTLLPTGELDEDYAAATVFGYDQRARPLIWAHGPVAGTDPAPLLTFRGYDNEQRLNHLQANAAGTIVQDHQIDYDPIGNVVEDNTFLNAKGWRECFGYDPRNRLTRAYTTATSDPETCAAGTPGSGDANYAYNDTYSYSPDGNLLSRVEGPDQTDVYHYTYPSGANAVRPHAPTAIDGPSESETWAYTWDPNGHQATRTNGGNTDTLVWSPDRLLDEIREANGNVKNSFVYDADGNRLVRRNVDGATGYIEGHELNANNSGSEIKVVRTYTLEGQPVAARTAQAGVEFLITDDQNSVELTVRSGGSTPQQERAYDPYGQKRSEDELATDRGWIGQIEDDRTGLNYLNARYYDPTMGRFLSPDPLLDMARPQTVNAYAYSMNNPMTFSDPGGMDPGWAHDRDPTNDCVECLSGSYLPSRSVDELELFAAEEEVREHDVRVSMIAARNPDLSLEQAEAWAYYFEYVQASSWSNEHAQRSIDFIQRRAEERSEDTALVGRLLDATAEVASDVGEFAVRNRQTIMAGGALLGYASCPFTAGVGCAVGSTLTVAAVADSAVSSATTCRAGGVSDSSCQNSLISLGLNTASWLGGSAGARWARPAAAAHLSQAARWTVEAASNVRWGTATFTIGLWWS